MFSECEETKETRQGQEPVNVVVELNCPMIWPSTKSEPESEQKPEQSKEV